MKPFDDFIEDDCKMYNRWWDILDVDEDDRMAFINGHMFRPYNLNIFKIGMRSEYFFKDYWSEKKDKND